MEICALCLHTTDQTKGELEDGGHVQALAYFKSGQVRKHGLSFEELGQVSNLERTVGSKPKFNDCSVLFLAMKLDAMLISGDKALRKAGRARHVEVHGTLWVMDQLVAGKVMSGAITAKLEHLLSLESVRVTGCLAYCHKGHSDYLAFVGMP